MSFAAPRQLVSPPAGGIPAADGAIMPWEAVADESLARQETWLLSFIDILALLLTLFVLLLAYQEQGQEENSADIEPVASIVIPFDLSLFALHSGVGLLPLELDSDTGYPVESEIEDTASEPELIDAVSAPTPVENVLDVPDLVSVEAEQHTVPLPELEGPPLPTPTEMVQQVFAQSQLPQSVEVLSRPGAVSIEISDNILFEPASAALSPAGQQLLNDVAIVLGELPYPLSVEGHTDNVPISSSRFPSNWELSSARAAMATRALIEQGIAADRLRAIGYGETRPRADNVSAEGRAKNRRVSFVLQVDEAEL